MSRRYYPVFMHLEDRLCVVVGGGAMALDKAEGLVQAGAEVRVIAAELHPDLRRLADDGRVEHIARDYRPGDLQGAFLVISERASGPRDERVYREASELRVPVNVVDDIPHCSFIAPSVVRRGDLMVAISTSGKAPALAVRLRQRLEEELGPHHARFLELAGEIRARMAERYPDFEERRRLWYELVDSDVVDLLERGRDAEARQRVAEVVGLPVETS